MTTTDRSVDPVRVDISIQQAKEDCERFRATLPLDLQVRMRQRDDRDMREAERLQRDRRKK